MSCFNQLLQQSCCLGVIFTCSVIKEWSCVVSLRFRLWQHSAYSLFQDQKGVVRVWFCHHKHGWKMSQIVVRSGYVLTNVEMPLPFSRLETQLTHMLSRCTYCRDVDTMPMRHTNLSISTVCRSVLNANVLFWCLGCWAAASTLLNSLQQKMFALWKNSYILVGKLRRVTIQKKKLSVV